MAVAGGLIPSGSHGDVIRGNHLQTGGKLNTFKQGGHEQALVVGANQPSPDGWAVIVLGFGDDQSEMGPLIVSWRDWSISVPRNIRVAVPPGHFNNLLNSTETKYFQPHEGAQLVGYDVHRYPMQILQWPKGHGRRMNEVQEEQKAVYDKIEVE